MSRNYKTRGVVLGIAAVTGLMLTSGAPARSAATVTISHQMRGCHAWSFNSGPIRPSLSVSVAAGTSLRFTNNDVMPHRLIQTAGPRLRLSHAYMNKMSSSAFATLAQPGIYRFTTKPGEDYSWAKSMHTTGEDHVLHLTVRVT